SSVSCGLGCGVHAEAERGAVAPHAVQDHRELARDCDPGARHAAASGDAHPPGAQARPLPAPYEQRMRRLVECGAGELVAASTDPALDVGLAGLIARRRQPEMCADIARAPEALGPVDGGAEG